MKNIAVFVSAGETNLQVIIDDAKKLKNYKVSLVISNKENVYGLVRAKKANIPFICIKSKEFSKYYLLYLIQDWLHCVSWIFSNCWC